MCVEGWGGMHAMPWGGGDMHAVPCVWRPESVLSSTVRDPGSELRLSGFVASVFTLQAILLGYK